jgi:hypothetical protein
VHKSRDVAYYGIEAILVVIISTERANQICDLSRLLWDWLCSKFVEVGSIALTKRSFLAIKQWQMLKILGHTNRTI